MNASLANSPSSPWQLITANIKVSAVSAVSLCPRRLTAQRSIEDAEEAERERRRRLRDASCWSNGGRSPSEESADGELLAEENNRWVPTSLPIFSLSAPQLHHHIYLTAESNARSPITYLFRNV